LAEGRLMADCFLDTNVFLYAAMRELSARDRPKRPIAAELIGNENFGLSSQVLAEFYVNARTKGTPLTHEEASGWLDRMAEQPCAAVDADLVRAGAMLADRYRISYWDGAILAAAHDLGATTLYTEDLNDGQTYGTVKVVNPFRSVSS
jgi:predicted nucleic acid-binding protein